MWPGLALAALIPRAVAAALRPPWHDEYFTCWAATLPWTKLLAALRLDSGPPLPYALVKLLTLAGLPPLVASRILAVAAGTGAVLLAARAARRAFGAEGSWWVGALLAFHPLAVAWSAEGRAYPLVLLAAAWAWDRLESLARGGTGAAGLALAVALACWSHTLGILLAAVLAVITLSLPRPARRRAVAAVAAGFASHLPWIPVAAHQPPAAIAWMTAFWQALPGWEKLAAPVRLLSPVGGFAATLDLPSPPWWVEVIGAVVVVWLLVAGRHRGQVGRRAALAILLPVTVLWFLAALGVPLLYPGRGEVVSLVPFALLLVGAAGGSRAWRAGAAGVCLAALAVTCVAIVGWANRPPSPERRLAAALVQRLPGGGAVVVGGYWRLGLSYHLGAARARFALVNYPASAASHPGWYDPASDRPGAGELDALLAAARASGRPTAVVVGSGLPTAADLQRLVTALALQPVLGVPGGELWAGPARGPA